MISARLRDVLIEHLDGPQPVVRNRTAAPKYGLDALQAANRMTAVWTLINRGLLRPDRRVHPRETAITDRGREVLCQALADWADAIVRAQEGLAETVPEMPRHEESARPQHSGLRPGTTVIVSLRRGRFSLFPRRED